MKKNAMRWLSALMAVVMCFTLNLSVFATESEANVAVTEDGTVVSTDETMPTSEDAVVEGNTEVNTVEDKVTEQTAEPVQGEVTQNVEEEQAVVEPELTDESGEEIVVMENDKPFLALGADLTPEQQNIVLGLMGIDPARLSEYNVVYVTNDMEHQYLDAYLPASTIGTKSLSSVLIMEGEKGSGIQISTKNISYCTVGMYKNALATAGLEDAQVIVAGPFPISGTAALIGAMQAYSQMTGDAVQEESLDAAMNELVVTGQLLDVVENPEQAEAMMAYLKQEVVKNGLDDEESISKVIDSCSEEFGVTLTEDQKNQLIDVLMKISDLDLDWNQLKNQASDLYDRLADMGLLENEGFIEMIKSIIQSVLDFVKGFLR